MIITFKREQQLKAAATQAGFKLRYDNSLLWDINRQVLIFTKKNDNSLFYYEIYNNKNKELKVIAGSITNGKVNERQLKPTTNFKDFLKHFKYVGLYLGAFNK